MGNCFSADDTQPEEDEEFAPVDEDDAGATEATSSAAALATVSQSESAAAAVDPKVAAVVEFIRELYERRKEVIPASGDEVAELLHNIRRLEEEAEPPRRVVMLKRSRSLLTSREVDLAGDGLRLQRFKVKTFNAGEPPPPPPKLGGVSK